MDTRPSWDHAETEGATPLDAASFSGSPASVSVLLSHGAKLSSRDKMGRTPLHYAAQGNSAEVTRLLLSEGANANAADSQLGQTPLFFAAENGFIGVAEILISRGAGVNVSDSRGMTPLLEAAQAGKTAMARLLVR